MRQKLQATAVAVGLGIVLCCAAGSVQAADLVQNGGFEQNTGGGQLGFNTTAADWATTGYNFLFSPGSADTTGVTGQYGNLQLWGPNNGSANGLPATSPDGGYYIGADGAYDAGPITQTISGLTIGAQYVVSFYWAGAQQSGFDGANTEQWQVSFGSNTQSTPVYDNSSHGFSGWMSQTFTFTADATSDVLGFLAIGTPIAPSVPPFALLDGVSVNEVSEPASIALLAVGAVALGGVVRRRRANRADGVAVVHNG